MDLSQLLSRLNGNPLIQILFFIGGFLTSITAIYSAIIWTIGMIRRLKSRVTPTGLNISLVPSSRFISSSDVNLSRIFSYMGIGICLFFILFPLFAVSFTTPLLLFKFIETLFLIVLTLLSFNFTKDQINKFKDRNEVDKMLFL